MACGSDGTEPRRSTRTMSILIPAGENPTGVWAKSVSLTAESIRQNEAAYTIEVTVLMK